MMHLYVFAEFGLVIGVEAYSREQAQDLAGSGKLVYCNGLRMNGTDPRIVFKYEQTEDGVTCQHTQTIAGGS